MGCWGKGRGPEQYFCNPFGQSQLPALVSGLWEGPQLLPWSLLPAGCTEMGSENGMTGLSSFIFPSPTVWAPLPPPQLRGPKEPPSGGEPEGPLLPALPGWCSWPPPGPVSIVAVMLGECLCQAGGRRRSSPSGGLDSGTLSQTSSHEPNTPLSPAVIGHPCGEAKAQRFRAHQGHTTC